MNSLGVCYSKSWRKWNGYSLDQLNWPTVLLLDVGGEQLFDFSSSFANDLIKPYLLCWRLGKMGDEFITLQSFYRLPCDWWSTREARAYINTHTHPETLIHCEDDGNVATTSPWLMAKLNAQTQQNSNTNWLDIMDHLYPDPHKKKKKLEQI